MRAFLASLLGVVIATSAAAQPEPARPGEPTPQGAQAPEEPPPPPKDDGEEAAEASGAIPRLESASAASPFYGRAIQRIEIVPVDEIGPLVFDYGFNVERILDQLYPNRANQRFWEDIGAFHFSIGLF